MSYAYSGVQRLPKVLFCDFLQDTGIVRCESRYLAIVYEVEFFVMVCHEEVEHKIDGKEGVKE